MNNNEHIKTYTAEDIKNYLNGRLSTLQMNAMEKAALDDPFLAEAMEGYAGMEDATWQQELIGLREHFAKQTEVRVVAVHKNYNKWFRAAAAILLIGGAATLSYFFINKKEPVEIAQQNVPASVQIDSLKTKSEIDEYVAPGTSSTETTTATEPKGLTTNNNPAANNQLAKVESEKITFDSSFVYTPSKTPSNKPQQESRNDITKQLEGSTAGVKVTTAEPSAVANNAAISVNAVPGKLNEGFNETVVADKVERQQVLRKKEIQQLNRNFNAQVVAPDNTPLPFANVSVKSEDFGTYADVKGNFKLVSSDSVLMIEVKAAGYKPQYYNLQSNLIQNRIVLTEDNNAFKDYKVITGNASAKSKTSRRATMTADSIVNVEPADGWDNYNTYVDNNIEIPDDILEKNIHGRVELTFEVKPNGAITNIKVDKSNCNNCDEAAKRLLQHGPQWKVKKGKSGKGRITVEF